MMDNGSHTMDMDHAQRDPRRHRGTLGPLGRVPARAHVRKNKGLDAFYFMRQGTKWISGCLCIGCLLDNLSVCALNKKIAWISMEGGCVAGSSGRA